MQIWILPSHVNAGTKGAAHLELATGWYIPNLTNCSSLCSIFSLRLYGTSLAQKYLGKVFRTWESTGICAWKGLQFIRKTTLYSDINVTTQFIWWMFVCNQKCGFNCITFITKSNFRLAFWRYNFTRLRFQLAYSWQWRNIWLIVYLLKCFPIQQTNRYSSVYLFGKVWYAILIFMVIGGMTF